MEEYTLMVLLVGVIIISCLLLKAGLERINIPGLVGYIALGFLIRWLDSFLGFMGADMKAVFHFLGKIGIVVLLFRVGLESNLAELLSQLPRAGGIWVGDVLFSLVGAFVAAYWWLHLSLVASLFAAVALSVTSVGVSLAVWHDKKALHSKNGELLLDVAEMDDLSGIAFMAILFSLFPLIEQHSAWSTLLPTMLKTLGLLLVKFILFISGCLLFAHYAEERVAGWFKKSGHPESTMLLVASTGFVIAALAGWLGFSVAIGALFAGLLFSRDPESVKVDTSFEPLYELFVPFFFVNIGLSIDPGSLQEGLMIGSILLPIALAAKLLGAGIPALFNSTKTGALLLATSMIPRAEITLIIMQRGLQSEAISSSLFSGIILVCAMTCLFIPAILHYELNKWPQTAKE